MKLIDRYIFFRVLTTMFCVLLVLVGIDTISSFVEQMDNLENRFTITEALLYAVLKIPGGLESYLGFCALIGAMIGLGSFTQTGELTVIRASGYSILQIGWMVLKPALFLILLGAVVTEFVAPRLEQMADSRRDLMRGNVTAEAEERGLWVFDKGSYLYLDAVYPGGAIVGLSRYRFESPTDAEFKSSARSRSSANDDPTAPISPIVDRSDQLLMSYAERAHYEDGKWYQSNGRWSRANVDGVNTGKYMRLAWGTELNPDLLDLAVLDAEQMSISDLSEYTEYLGEDNIESREYQVEFWSKVLQPLSIATLVFVGISFVVGSSRQVAVGERIFIGVIVGVVFRVVQDILGPAATVWGFAPILAVLIPILMTLLVGIFLLKARP